MSDLIDAVRAKDDAIRVLVVTRHFEMEGEIYCPRQGKQGRRLSRMLNNKERQFLALTNVQVLNRRTNTKDEKIYPLIQVCMHSVEYICPYLDALEAEQESLTLDHDSIS